VITKVQTEKVYLYARSGMLIGTYPILSCDDKTVTLLLRNGEVEKFSRETGRQIDPRKKHYGLHITEEPFEKEVYRITL
jgi:hypothetical protein